MEEYFGHTRLEMMPFVPLTAKRILEVGCGEGLFGKQIILRQSAEVWGIEPNREAIEKAAINLTKIICGYFSPDCDLPLGYFDCIIFNDVLEHMYYPKEALGFAKKLLIPESGVIVCSIPNFRYWENMIEIVLKKQFDYKDQGILDNTHIRFFTKYSIIKLINSLDYKILYFEGINRTSDWKFKIVNFLSANKIKDMSFLQYAVVAGLR